MSNRAFNFRRARLLLPGLSERDEDGRLFRQYVKQKLDLVI